MTGDRPKHQNPDLEKLLRDLEAAGWRITKGKGYFKAYCPCGEHLNTVHLTPNRDYPKRLRGRIKSSTCWEG